MTAPPRTAGNAGSSAPPVDDAAKRGTLIAMILASGVVFLDGTAVSVALPAIGRELRAGLSGLQWIVNGYTLTLAALLILGGSLGDHYGRKRMLVVGLAGFGAASLLCALAPTVEVLIAARMLQGVTGALLVPEGLAILSAVFTNAAERGAAIGAWTGWGGIVSVVGPFLGGLFVERGFWRGVFLLNIPLIAVVLWLVARYVPETRDEEAPKRLDWAGAALVILGLGGIAYGLTEGPGRGWTDAAVLGGLVGGVLLLVAFVVVEARVRGPMVPLGLFRNGNFTGANLATLGMYAALGGASFFLVIYVQNTLRYPAIAAGATLLPVSALMLLFASRFGTLSGRYGPRRFMVAGPALTGIGLLLLLLARPGANYWTSIFPAALLLGAGLCVTVAPLTSTVMGSVPTHQSGIASAINNVASRVAGLLAVAGLGAFVALSFAAGLEARAGGLSPDARAVVREAGRSGSGAVPAGAPPEAARVIEDAYTDAFHGAMVACAALAFASAALSFATVRDGVIVGNNGKAVAEGGAGGAHGSRDQ